MSELGKRTHSAQFQPRPQEPRGELTVPRLLAVHFTSCKACVPMARPRPASLQDWRKMHRPLWSHCRKQVTPLANWTQRWKGSRTIECLAVQTIPTLLLFSALFPVSCLCLPTLVNGVATHLASRAKTNQQTRRTGTILNVVPFNITRALPVSTACGLCPDVFEFLLALHSHWQSPRHL